MHASSKPHSTVNIELINFWRGPWIDNLHWQQIWSICWWGKPLGVICKIIWHLMNSSQGVRGTLSKRFWDIIAKINIELGNNHFYTAKLIQHIYLWQFIHNQHLWGRQTNDSKFEKNSKNNNFRSILIVENTRNFSSKPKYLQLVLLNTECNVNVLPNTTKSSVCTLKY